MLPPWRLEPAADACRERSSERFEVTLYLGHGTVAFAVGEAISIFEPDHVFEFGWDGAVALRIQVIQSMAQMPTVGGVGPDALMCDAEYLRKHIKRCNVTRQASQYRYQIERMGSAHERKFQQGIVRRDRSANKLRRPIGDFANADEPEAKRFAEPRGLVG